MRTLHETRSHEKLLARGQYHVLRDGEETGKVEHWNLHRQPDGSHVLRADQDGREVTDPAIGDASLLVHLITDPAGQTDRLHVRYHDATRNVDAQLTIFPGYATVRRYQDWKTIPAPGEIELPGEVFALSPCLSTTVAHAYDEQAGESQSVQALEVDLDAMLEPGVRAVALRYAGTVDLTLPGVGDFTTRHFVEDDASDVYLDEHGIVLKRTWRDGDADHEWTGVLTAYTRLDD